MRTVKRALAVGALCLAAMAGTVHAQVPASPQPQKIILDTDFNNIGDDGKTLIMAAQLHAVGVIDLLGVTIVAGNDWLNQETAYALKAVERMGIADTVGVYAGARGPLVHDQATIAAEKALFGGYIGGAWQRPEPADDKLTPPLDGFATRTRVKPQHAADFIAETVKAHPHQVTIVAIGPMTNLALAIRMHPEITPLIGRIVFMAGAFEVPGNTTPAAEMNVWFDPEAARIVMRQPIDMTFIPLDVTNTVPMTKAVYDRATRDKTSIIARLMAHQGEVFARDPAARPFIYDTLALAYAIDPTLATDAPDLWVDVDTSYGPGYGRTYGYSQARAANYMRKARVIRRFDNDRFYALFTDLLSRPTPVRFTARPR